MGELGLNKIFGALLAIGLVILGLREVSTIVFGGGHHEHHEYESLNEWAESNFKGFRVDIAEVGGGADIVEEIYDLGALLLAADVSVGERSFRAKCASCHTIEQGGPNGTGPNLYGILGAEKQAVSGFNYSGALSSTEGNWSWTNMDAWLANPSAYARGTSMAFAGLNRDDERASVLAYLASYSPDAPPPPDPLPAPEETGDLTPIDGETVDENPSEATGEIVVQDATLGESVEAIASDTASEVEAPLVGEGENTIEPVANPGVDDAGEASPNE